MFGTNSNGLKGKIDSLNNALKQFGRPSFVTVQETKLRSNNFKIPGYQVYQKNRIGLGGGILTAIDENIGSVLVSSTESEILVVQTKIGDFDLRVINAYGPQELDSERENVYQFWRDLEKEVILVKNSNCKILIQMDANAKVGCEIIQNDPNARSNNGGLLLALVERQNLSILNASDLCVGVITRHRKTITGEEKSVIDYIIVCDILLNYLEQMLIDESRTHVLTKYGKTSKTESDHNILYAKFAITYYSRVAKTKREIFNFRNEGCQKKFFEVTDNTNKLSSCFQSEFNFEKQSSNFFKTLNGTFQQCFKKIRITDKTQKKKQCSDEISVYLELKSKLQCLTKDAKSDTGRLFIEKHIQDLDQKIMKLSATKNARIINDHLSQFQTPEGSFSQTGLWKVKRKLLPRKTDPPMAKKDAEGNLITGTEALKNLYIQTYSDRLKHQEMKEEFLEIYQLKTLLWNERTKSIKKVKSEPWTRLGESHKNPEK